MLQGIEALQQALNILPDLPGVYEMIDTLGRVLYVGKAKRLRRRVVSYTRVSLLPLRLKRMVSNVHSVHYTVTHNELEALLLEHNLIQKKKPPFNILLKEGRLLLYLTLTAHEFPALLAKRSGFAEKEAIFGPFLNRDALETTKNYIHKAFQLRSCSDRVFSGRRRPCLQYYIKCCSGPCVAKISSQEYEKSVEEALHILNGKSDAVEKNLLREMHQASTQYAYEKAALLRDRLRWVHQAKTAQSVGYIPKENIDVIAVCFEHGVTCVQLCCFRKGANYGGHHFFFPNTAAEDISDVLNAFMRQFYINVAPPQEIILSHGCSEPEEILEAFKELHHISVVLRCTPKDEEKQKILAHAVLNAEHALKQYTQSQDEVSALLHRMRSVFHLSCLPQTIEVYDNSHFQGHHSYGGMVRFEEGVWVKRASKQFFMGKTMGDDHALLREMLIRRYAEKDNLPNLMIIDGGKGHISTAYQVLCDLGLSKIDLVGIAKGPYHRDGQETFYQIHRPPTQFEETDSLLHLFQRLRNKAHEYVIQAYRRKHRASTSNSIFDQLPGIGPLRKKKLLCLFPDADSLRKASRADLQAVPGFSKCLAEKIYNFLHEDDGKFC